MIAANITAMIALVIWGGLAWLGHTGLSSISRQKVPGYPIIEQIDHLLTFPLICVAVIGVACGLVNGSKKGSAVLGIAAGSSIVFALFYLVTLTGGI